MNLHSAYLYEKIKGTYPLNQFTATIVEFLLLALIVASMYSVRFIRWELATPYIGKAAGQWVTFGVTNIPFIGLFIVAMALGKGKLSGFLSTPLFILLGEISFSIYLLHQLLIRVFKLHIKAEFNIPWWVSYTYFWIILLLTSYLMWQFVEKPCRKIIIDISDRCNWLNSIVNAYQSVEKRKAVVSLILIVVFTIPLIVK